MASEADRKEMLRRVREKIQQKKGGRQKDPNEWRPPQVEEGKELKLKGFILPPISPDDRVASGQAEGDMNGLFYFQVGDHWINNKKFPCPRVYDNEECPYCQLGFDLMKEVEDKKARSELAKNYLPKTSYVVNVYFPPYKTTPEDLRGKVVYYAAPKTIFDVFDKCLNRDDAGDDSDTPEPFGMFYDETDAYPFLFHITKKGDYNDYTQCKFLATARGPIADDPQKIAEILARRHDIPMKYPQRTPENMAQLEKFVEDLLKGSTDDGEGGGGKGGSGFDSDEVEQRPTQKTQTSPPRRQRSRRMTTSW
jgi:hypothetical protein